jgi:hypothetical protein
MANQTLNYDSIRAEASINALNALLSSSIMVFILEFIFKKEIAKIAVSYADQLVEELKKNN